LSGSWRREATHFPIGRDFILRFGQNSKKGFKSAFKSARPRF